MLLSLVKIILMSSRLVVNFEYKPLDKLVWVKVCFFLVNVIDINFIVSKNRSFL